jgi:hypothetical protein
MRNRSYRCRPCLLADDRIVRSSSAKLGDDLRLGGAVELVTMSVPSTGQFASAPSRRTPP